MAVLSIDQAFLRAYESYREGRTDEAIAMCRAVLKAQPDHPYSAFLLALMAARDGHDDEAEQLLAHAVERRAHSITLDFPPPDRPRHVERPNPALQLTLEENVATYSALLQSFARFLPHLGAIPATAGNEEDPHWRNQWIPALDGIALYCLTALTKPRRYVEVGSGISTRFVRRAIRDHGLSTIIVSIDPEPRAAIDTLCDELIRTPLERVDLRLFQELAAGDIVFVDSSHRCFTGSDVTLFFTEVLPSLEAGVTVGVHDIFLPYDYPAEWVPRYYSEQYLLACYLLAGRMPFRVILPTLFALTLAACADAVRTLATVLPAGVAADGGSFWVEMTAERSFRK